MRLMCIALAVVFITLLALWDRGLVPVWTVLVSAVAMLWSFDVLNESRIIVLERWVQKQEPKP